MQSKVAQPIIRSARLGDERGIHKAHMRSIREVCAKAHGPDEIEGWGNRPFSDKWSQLISSGTLWIVELNDQIQGVGYIKIGSDPTKDAAHIFGLYLTPEVIGKGLGAKLMTMMLEKAKEAGSKVVTLDSSLNAHEFYLRFGFKDTGPLKFSEIGGSQVQGYPMSLILSV